MRKKERDRKRGTLPVVIFFFFGGGRTSSTHPLTCKALSSSSPAAAADSASFPAMCASRAAVFGADLGVIACSDIDMELPRPDDIPDFGEVEPRLEDPPNNRCCKDKFGF